MNDPKAILDKFYENCVWVWAVIDQHRKLYETSRLRLQLYEEVAPMFFHDIQNILLDYIVIQVCRITDPAQTMGNDNLTVDYLVDKLAWPPEVHRKLDELRSEMKTFRKYMVEARNKVAAHADLRTSMSPSGDLGKFAPGEDAKFLRNLQEFIDVAYAHLSLGDVHPIDTLTQYDADDVVKALKKAVAFDAYVEASPKEAVDWFFNSKYSEA